MSGEIAFRLALEPTGVWTLYADDDLLEGLHGSSELDHESVLAWASATARDEQQASVEFWSPDYAAGDLPVYCAIASGPHDESDRDERRARYSLEIDGDDRPDDGWADPYNHR